MTEHTAGSGFTLRRVASAAPEAVECDDFSLTEIRDVTKFEFKGQR